MINLVHTALSACLVFVLAGPVLAQQSSGSATRGGRISAQPDVLYLTPPTGGGDQTKKQKAPAVTSLAKTYTDSRDEALKKMTKLILKPPKDPKQARSELATLLAGPQRHLDHLERALIKMQASGGTSGMVVSGHSSGPLDVKTERESLGKMATAASVALEHQLKTAFNARFIKKATEDAPLLIKALVEELQAVDDKLKDFLSLGARERERKKERLIKLVETVTGNVAGVWAKRNSPEGLVVLNKKLLPETQKKSMKKAKTAVDTVVHEVGHQVNESYKTAATEISKGLKKSQDEYQKTYTAAVSAQKPLQDGTALNSVPTFKGIKPSELDEQGRLIGEYARTGVKPAGLIPVVSTRTRSSTKAWR